MSDSVSTRVAFLLFCGLWSAPARRPHVSWLLTRPCLASPTAFLFSIVFIVGALFAAGNIAFSIVAHLVWLGLTFIFFLSGSAALTSIVRHHHWNHQSRLQILEGWFHLLFWASRAFADLAWLLAGFAWTETILVFIAIFFVLAIGTKRGEGIRGGVADA